MTKRLNTRDAHEGIRELVDFNAGNVNGRNVYYRDGGKAAYYDNGDWTNGYPRGLSYNAGYMPRAFANDYLESLKAGKVRYVVWSYLTVIAWLHEDEGWIIPNVRYSATTSQHQYTARYGARLWREDQEPLITKYDAGISLDLEAGIFERVEGVS